MSWILARAVLGRLQCRSCPEAVSAFGKAARQKRGDGAIIPRHFRGLWVVPGWCSESRGEVGGIQGHGLVSSTVAGWQSWWYADGACCHRFCVFPPQASLKELFDHGLRPTDEAGRDRTRWAQSLGPSPVLRLAAGTPAGQAPHGESWSFAMLTWTTSLEPFTNVKTRTPFSMLCVS